jgi:uncharacterized protein
MLALFWASTLVDVAFSSLALRSWRDQRVHRRSLPLGRLRQPLVWLGIGVVLWLVRVAGLLVSGRIDPFGVIHLLYLDLVVGLPLLGGLALFQERNQRHCAINALVKAAAVGCCLAAPIGLYGSFVEPYRLQLERAGLSLAPSRTPASPIRIGVIADIQMLEIGAHERLAVERVMAETPDLILLPGDLIQVDQATREQQLASVRRLLGGLDAPGGVYMVLGDVDQREYIQRAVAGTRVRLLVNELAQTSVRNRAVSIAGVELNYASPAARRTMQSLESAPGEADVRLLLTHRPDSVYSLRPNSRVDLTVAGHTHGGQIQVPLFGPLTWLSGVPRKVGAGGLHLVDGRPIYVSRGVGLERGQAPRVRLFCPPEVSLVELA